MKYKVAIDMRYVEDQNSGLSRFSINIFYNLIKNTFLDDIRYVILLPPRKTIKDFNFFPGLDLSNVKLIYAKNNRGLKWKFPFFIFDLSLYFILKKNNIKVFISPYIDPPILPGIKIISTIHDLIFLRVKNYFNRFKLLKRFLSELRIIITLFYSNKIITVSKTSKYILINRYKNLPFLREKLENISVIYNGITSFECSKISSEIKSFYLNEKYVLYVGDRRNHKNLIYTIDLIKSYNKSYKQKINLVIAGSKSFKNYNLQKIIEANHFVKEIINPSDSMLDYLYRNCIALILLSFDEGFGIPIIEAAFRSKKIILSDIEIFNEIAPRHSLKLNLNYKFTHLKLLHNYLKNEISIDLQSIVEKWSWDKSSLKLRKMLLLKLKEYT